MTAEQEPGRTEPATPEELLARRVQVYSAELRRYLKDKWIGSPWVVALTDVMELYRADAEVARAASNLRLASPSETTRTPMSHGQAVSIAQLAAATVHRNQIGHHIRHGEASGRVYTTAVFTLQLLAGYIKESYDQYQPDSNGVTSTTETLRILEELHGEKTSTWEKGNWRKP